MAERVLQIGLIGLGWGTHHLKMLVDNLQVKVKAICDVNEKLLDTIGTEFGISHRFVDYHDILAFSELDAVLVALPNNLHLKVTCDAFAAGKHVLCEKPPAMNVEQTGKLFDAAEAAGKQLMIGFVRRFEFGNKWLKTCAEEERFGEIYYARAGWLRRRMSLPGWFTNREQSGGGPLIDIGVHLLDLIMWIMRYPTPKSVTGFAYNKFSGTGDVEDLGGGLIRLENGATVILEASQNLNIKEEMVYGHICGTKAGLNIYPPRIYEEQDGLQMDVIPNMSNVPEAYAAQWEHFSDCIFNNKKPITTKDEMITLMQIIEGIYDSARNGIEVVF